MKCTKNIERFLCKLKHIPYIQKWFLKRCNQMEIKKKHAIKPQLLDAL